MRISQSESVQYREGFLPGISAFFSRPHILSVEQTATHLTRGSTSEIRIDLSGWGHLKVETPECAEWMQVDKRSFWNFNGENRVSVCIDAPKGMGVQISFRNFFGRSRTSLRLAPVSEELRPIPVHEVGKRYVVDDASPMFLKVDLARFQSSLDLPNSVLSGAKTRPVLSKFIGKMKIKFFPQIILISTPIDVKAIRPTRRPSDIQHFLANVTIPEEC